MELISGAAEFAHEHFVHVVGADPEAEADFFKTVVCPCLEQGLESLISELFHNRVVFVPQR